jgi:hypothetical protein
MKRRFPRFRVFLFKKRELNCTSMRRNMHDKRGNGSGGRLPAGEIDGLLSVSEPLPRVPVELHEDIMRAVRREAAREEKHEAGLRAFRLPWLRPWAVAMALAAVMGVLGWQYQRAASHAKIDTELRAQWSATWTFIGQFGTNVPVLLTKPIEARLSELTNDLQNTTDQLLAKLP